MVTLKKRPFRLFIKEWQEHKQLSAETMAERLGIERESYYRLIREQHRINMDKLVQLANAMGADVDPRDLQRHPSRPSLDAMLDTAPEDIQETAVDIMRRLVKKAS